MVRFALALVALTSVAPSSVQASLCVENGSHEGWLFTADSDSGGRASATLAPGARLCLKSDGPGTVAVFASADDLEGCSRRVSGDSIARMLDFPGVDLCAWEVMRPN